MMIDRSTDADMEDISDWLAHIAPAHARPLHRSRAMVQKGHRTGNLYVLRHRGRAVSLALGSAGMIDLLGTHPAYRSRGFGGALAEHCIRRAAQADMAAIEIECLPETALPFWQSLGFQEIEPRFGHNRWAMLRVPKQHDLPPGAAVDVMVRTFDARALHSSDDPPLSEYRPAAVLVAGRAVQLAKRVVLHEPHRTGRSDLAVEITLNGQRLVFEQVNRRKMEAFGVRHDRFRQFFIDRIFPNGAAE